MNIIQNAVLETKQVPMLPGESIFLAIEEFIENAIAYNTEQNTLVRYLSLEDVSPTEEPRKSLTLAVEDITTTVATIIIAIGIAVGALIYKLYKHFFGSGKDGEKSMHDQVTEFADNVESGVTDVSDLVEATTDARYTIQDPEEKKAMMEKIDALTKDFEAKHSDNIKFAVINDNKNGKRFLTYYKHLSDIVIKLDRDLLDLEAQLDKGADLLKTISKMNAGDTASNAHLNSLLTKETQILNDKLDLYHVKAESLKLDEAYEALMSYRAQLQNNPLPGNFFASLSKNDAKAFISTIMRQEAINMKDLSARIQDTKEGMDVIIKTTKKYEGIDKTISIDANGNAVLSAYLTALRKGMLTVRNHAKSILAIAKAEDLLYKSAYECCVILIQYTADMADIVNNFSKQDSKISIKTTKGKMASFFKTLTGKK